MLPCCIYALKRDFIFQSSITVPDFRGPNGIWTQENKNKRKRKKGNKRKKAIKKIKSEGDDGECDKNNNQDDDTPKTTIDADDNSSQTEPSTLSPSQPQIPSFTDVKPTLTHRAITKLTQLSKIKYTITQNVDGLHMRSGLPRSNYCFLHGCIFTEKCEDCGKEYFRDFDIGGVRFQKTGRFCDGPRQSKSKKGKSTDKSEICGGCLRDTVLDWEDALPEDDWIRSQEECAKSDLVLALGTSLRIEPAGSLPTLAEKFVIINKQVTPYDHHTKVALTIRADIEYVFDKIMSNLSCVEENWDYGNTALIKKEE